MVFGNIYTQIPVEFSSGANQLAGVLTRPVGSGPFPSAIFIHGSGSATRTGYGQYPQIFEAFAKHGIASLSWDKPGTGESTGNFLDQSYEDRAAEGVAAIEFLRQREEIDSSKVGLWGISQAGWVMPLICKSLPDIAFMIAVGVTVTTVEDQDRYRITRTLPADGYSAEDTQKALDLIQAVHQLALRDASFDEAVAQLGQHSSERWAQAAFGTPSMEGLGFLKRIIRADPRPHMKSITCPTLVLFGEKDTLSDVSLSIETYERILGEASNDDVTVKVFPDADHSIKVTKTGGQEEMSLQSQTGDWQFAPGYLEFMSNWLSSRVNAG